VADQLDVASIIGPGGRIAKRLKMYEHRPQQLEMAAAVAEALQRGEHLVAEAGTGTGKSFAYLVPAIMYATADQGRLQPSGKSHAAGKATASSRTGDDTADQQQRAPRVLISTHTISLQEQLIAQDIPLLNSVIPREFSAVLVKGRSNYISLRRLKNADTRAAMLFNTDEQLGQLRALKNWAKETTDGSLASVPFKPIPTVWEEVASDTGNCLGKRCDTFAQCHYFQARRRASHAQLLIVNHAMFFSDLALRRLGVSLLPDYDAVVLDECHTIEAVAGDYLGIRLTSSQIDYQLNKLYNDRTQKGLLITHDLKALQRMVDQCRFATSNYFADILDWWDKKGDTNGRVNTAGIVDNVVSEPLEELAGRIKHFANSLDDESEKKNFDSAHDRLLGLSAELKNWNQQNLQDAVYWIERESARRGFERVTLAAAPIDVGATLRSELFQNQAIKSVIMTSATLAVGNDERFRFFRSRIGLSGGMSVRVGSPFRYDQQAEVILVTGLPDPSAQRAAFEAALPAQIKRFITKTDGHAFVLFTSYDLLKRSAAAVLPWLTEQGMLLLSQAGDQNRTQLIEQFKSNRRSVLFGTDSFWQGVDVPGDALQNVIITKLPFSVPDHPLLQARLEAIRQGGGNPFNEYQLPESVIKFRQGFGRLIRTATDRGIVVVLDPRIRSKPYGKTFLESLPPMPVRTVSL
jgi:ATP-dependent DNA helicase DinG